MPTDQTASQEKPDVRIWLDQRCFMSPDGRGVQLCYVTTAKDSLDERIKTAGYYGTIRQALMAYVDEVLKGQPAGTAATLIHLFAEIEKRIERIHRSIDESNSMEVLPPPRVTDTVRDGVARKRVRRGSPPVDDAKTLRLCFEDRNELCRIVATEFHDKELTPGLLWGEVPHLMASNVTETLAGYSPPPYAATLAAFTKKEATRLMKRS